MKRTLIQIRLAEQGVQALDSMAKLHNVTRTDVIRACLVVAFGRKSQVEAVLQQKGEEL